MTHFKIVKSLTSAACVAAISGMALLSPAQASEKATVVLLTATPDGRFITFEHDGDEVKSKVSGKRTKVVINGQTGDRANLKAGMTCDIDYEPGRRNEPATLDCK